MAWPRLPWASVAAATALGGGAGVRAPGGRTDNLRRGGNPVREWLL